MTLLVLYALGLVLANLATLVDLQLSRFDGTAEQARFEDYIAFYAAGDLVLEGDGSNLYDIDTLTAKEVEIAGREVGGRGSLAFFNPPFVALLFAPLALLSSAGAAFVLLLLNTVLVAVAAAILHRSLEIRTARMNIAYWVGVLSFEPAVYVIGQGQLSLFLVFGFLGFYCFQRQGKPLLSGLSLALLLVKPQAAVLAIAILLWKRQWAALAPLAAVASVLVLVSTAVSGPSVLLDYPRFLIESSAWEGTRGIDTQGMYGWNGFFSTLTTYREAPHLAFTAVATLGTIGVVLYTFRGKWNPESSTFPLAVAVLAQGTLLINPHAYLHDAALVGLALALGLVGLRHNREKQAIWLAITFAAWLLFSRTLWLLAEFNLNLVTPMAAGILLILAREALKHPSTESEQTPKSTVYGIHESRQAETRIAS